MNRRLLLPLGALIAATAAYPWWLPWLGRYLVREDAIVQAPYAVVMAGDSLGYRILRGAQLAKDGIAGKVLVSGSPGTYDFYESDLAVRFAEKRGFDEALFEALHMEYHSTQEEAHAIAAELKRRGVKRVLVVTSDYHTRRTGKIWQYTAPWLDVRMVAAPDRYFRPDTWWRDREGAKHVYSEWTKLAAYSFDFFAPAGSGPVLP